MQQNSNLSALLEKEIGHATMATQTAADGQDPFALPPAGEQTASLQTAIGGLLRPRTKNIINARKARGAAADGPTREQLDSILTQIEAEEAAKAGKVVDPADTTTALPDAQKAPDTPTGSPDEPPAAAPVLNRDGDTEKLLDDYQAAKPVTTKYGEESGLNLTRHHEGANANRDLENMAPDEALEKMQTAEDVGRLLEAAGKQTDARGVRTHAEVKSRTDTTDKIREELADVFSGKQVGLMTDVQLHSARRMLATLGEDVASLADNIAGGNHEAHTLMQYQRKGEALIAVQRFLQGQVTEVARALSQQRSIAQTVRAGSIQDMQSIVANEGGTIEEIVRHAKVANARNKSNGAETEKLIADETTRLKAEGKSDAEIEQFVNDLKTIREIQTQRKTWDSKRRMGVGLAVEYWKAQILSGVETHVVNMSSNAVVNMWESLVIRPTAGLVGEARAMTGKLMGKEDIDHVYLAETMPALVSGYAGIRDGLAAMWHVMKTMESDFSGGTKADRTGAMEKAGAAMEKHGAAAGAAGRGTANVLGLSFRMLQAEDDLFKTLNFRQELTALSVRESYRRGFTGKDAYTEAAKIMEDPPDIIYDAAMEAAKRATFTNEDLGGVTGVLAEGARKITASVPELKFVVPFITTPANLVSYAFDTSALATVSPRLWRMINAGGAQRDVAVAKMITGIGFTTLVYQWYQSGIITGSGPDNPDQRRVMERTGYKPNSIRAGDTYISMKRTDPFAGSMFALVNKLDAAKYTGKEDDFAQLFMEGAFGIAEHAMNSTFMRSVNDMTKMINGDYPADKFLTNYATGFIPFSSGMKDVSQLIDPQQRRGFDDKEFQTGFSQQLQNKVNMIIPGRSRYMAPARHWDGIVVNPGMGEVAFALSPFKTSTARKGSRIDKEMIKNGISIGEPNPIITLGRGQNAVHFSMLDMDNGRGLVYDAYAKRIGKARLETMRELLEPGSDYYELGEGKKGERYNEINRRLAQAERIARNEFMEEELVKAMKNNDPDTKRIARRLAVDPEILLDMAEQIDIESATKGHVKPGRGKGAKPLPLPPHMIKEQKGTMPRM